MPTRKTDYTDEEQRDDQSSLTRIAVLGVQYRQITDQLASISDRVGKIDARFDVMGGRYVTMDRYLIVERIVFGMVSLILISVVGALMTLLLHH